MINISDLIAFLALAIAVIGWIYAANERRQLQKWVRRSMIVGSRLKVADEYVIEAGKLAEKIQDLITLKQRARKMGLIRRAWNDIAQFRVWWFASRHNDNISKLELNVSDILEIIDDPELEERKVQLQTATQNLYTEMRKLNKRDFGEDDIDVGIEHSKELLREINKMRVAFRREIDATLLRM